MYPIQTNQILSFQITYVHNINYAKFIFFFHFYKLIYYDIPKAMLKMLVCENKQMLRN